MSLLSLLQLRNLSAYRIENPIIDPKQPDYVNLIYLKQEFKVNVPVVNIQNIVNNLQNVPSKDDFVTALRGLNTSINTLIPPVHDPTSLNDILSELKRFMLVSDPMDQEILFLDYIPFISTYVDTTILRTDLGTDKQKLTTSSFVNDFGNRVTALQDITKVPGFDFLKLSYESFVKSRQLARSDQEAEAVLQTYKSLILNVSSTSLNVSPWTFPTNVSLLGFYTASFVPTSNTFMVYIAEQTPGLKISNGWSVNGLTGISGNVRVVEYTSNVYGDVVINRGPPAVSFPFVSNALVVSDQPNLDIQPSSMIRLTFTPPVVSLSNVASSLTNATAFSIYAPQFEIGNVIGTPGELRDLNSNVFTSEGKEVYHTVIDRGSGTGALTALAAVGAQDKFLYGGESRWIPRIRQHTPFVINQRLSLPLLGAGGYLGKTVQVDIHPQESGDLISNMYLQCSLPALPSPYYYTELVGRAIMKKVEFLIDGEVYESLTDDWYIMNDQLTLDADEKLGMYQLVSNGVPEGSNVTATSLINLIVPLELFFCRRFTHMRQNKKPYFPMCALTNSTVSIRFTFNSSAWITNSATPVELINPRLIIEEITLTPEERMYYRGRTMNFRVPRVWKEAVQTFTNGTARINLTADFPANMLIWFIRNKKYEQDNRLFYNSRYAYGYTTDYIVAATPVTFFNGVQLRYIDTIDYATLYLNNNNVLSNFPGGLYYTFKQSIDHGLSVPTKSLYMYCFSEKPLQYNHDGGSLNFSKFNSQTTHLDIKFNDKYAPQIQSEFSLNMFYYGYVNLEISGGRARLQ